ncbi:MAG: hypothetical protein NC337_04220 [Roseburia sp.]|nr:hypothetical protein [Roseburia sp.]
MRRSSFIFNFRGLRGKNWGRPAAVLVFLGLMTATLLLVGNIVRAKFIGDSTTIVDGFYVEEKNDIDMLVIGSSNSFCTIDPLILYENYGIAAYDFGSSSQPMNISVLYLREALKEQKPALVAFEVNMLLSDPAGSRSESALRWGYTDMPLSADKLRSIYQSVGAVNAEYVSYVFPALRYHNRWKELSKTDYTYFYKDKTNHTKGYLETQQVSEAPIDLAAYDSEGETWIAQENIRYLDELVRICRENGAELLLFKSPKEGWYRHDTEAVRALAGERGLDFVDYNELYYRNELELDVTHDFRDAQHLNDFGARKVSLHFGAYVKERYALADRRGEAEANSWDRALLYRQRCGAQEYMAAANAKECLKLLQDDENYILIVTDAAAGGANEVRQWVYEDRAIVFERLWQESGLVHRRLGTDSELVLSRYGDLYQILIDGVEQYQPQGRWSIIVYDKITGKIAANLRFDE